MIDEEAALQYTVEFAQLCVRSLDYQRKGQGNLGLYSSPTWVEIDYEITKKLPMIEAIARRLDDRLVAKLREPDRHLTHEHKLEAAQELEGHITSLAEIAWVTGTQGPKLSATEMHSWVWEEAAPRWDAGFYRDAVQAAATRIFDVELPKKLRVQPAKNPADLFAAFAPDKSTGTVLRFRDVDPDSVSWASLHRGTMLVCQGCVMSIRNPRTHRLAVREEQVVLEELATLSLIARWIDDAEAVPASAE